VTHEHGDHSKSIKDVMKAGIDVYASKGTFETLNITGHRIKPVKAKEQFRIGTWTILPFDIKHDAAEPICFLLANSSGEKLVYITDTAYSPYKFKGITHYMIEINYDKETLNGNVEQGVLNKGLKKRIMKSHFSLEHAVDFFRESDLSKTQEIWILHLSDSNSNENRIKQKIQEVTGKQVIIAKR
jgi:phosphoribosyl 1,2-cyclic phosphodiesterase